jgi:uncharacterized membrane protein YqiK
MCLAKPSSTVILVDQGHKGVWAKPIYPGMHPINTDTMKVDLIPTTNVVLNWATNRNEAHNLDKNLSSITVRSKDGFSYNLDVSVVIHIGALEASKVISRMGSMSGLISQVLEPTIGNYFRNSAQEYAPLTSSRHVPKCRRTLPSSSRSPRSVRRGSC